ncbi:hypothetical protein B0A48_09290 [Cryoendolithus antarcticus]|uniref:Uncharacterized protein n=1 Tax=Cryoendolithus antarcticus TaxID=1507870 RepID=A0A1V8T2M9_9PEZI|nr:hypothetical protein B0A48_09290 [Cryoendolithus antarcticus]
MLPPTVHPSARPRSVSLPSLQSRTFFNWRRNSRSWNSQIDPSYHRYNTHRNLKDRVRLMKAVSRRAQFNWDVSTRPLFSPRYASHWYGNRYGRCGAEESGKKAEGEEYELIQKEREWKAQMEGLRRGDLWREQMEVLRKRVEQDPYETVFGKRFEPFWSYWFPREEYGLPPKQAESVSKVTEQTPANTGGSVEAMNSTAAKPATIVRSSSTTWDSWTNKTERTEWDSASGQTKCFEYDPVSNRMRLVEESKPVKANEVRSLSKGTSRPSTEKQTLVEDKSASVAVQVRKAIVVPTETAAAQQSKSARPLLDSHVATHVGNSSSKPTMTAAQAMAQPPFHVRPGVPTNRMSPDLEGLTADSVRASVGKHPKHVRLETKKERLLRDNRRLQVKVESVDRRLKQFEGSNSSTTRLSSASKPHTQPNARPIEPLQTSMQRNATAKPVEQPTTPLQPAVVRMQSTAQREPVDLDDAAAHESTEPITPASNLPKGWTEQTEILQADRVRRTAARVPVLDYGRSDVATKVASAKAQMYARATPKWVTEMFSVPQRSPEELAADAAKTAKAQKAQALLETEVKQQQLAMQLHENRAKIAKHEARQTAIANASPPPTAVVPDTNDQEKLIQKIRSLRGELDIAYKQSSVHADEFKHQIHKLEARVADAKQTAAARSEADLAQSSDIEARYRHKLRALKDELDIAYKQSAVHGGEFRDQIKKLEYRIADMTAKSSVTLTEPPAPARKDSGVELDVDAKMAMQGEGDFCTNVTKWADSSKWYKQVSPAASREAEKVDNKAQDRELVNAVRRLYENRYGVIDTEHRQVKEDARDGWLAKHDEEVVYDFQDDGLEAQLQSQPVAKAEPVTESTVAALPAAATAETPDSLASATVESNSLKWDHPPVYKVLAYDSGNDMMSTATTSSWLTETDEKPLSITHALDQLYQPARFVSAFAEMQDQGYQVVHAGKDVLVFKKVKRSDPVVDEVKEPHGWSEIEAAAKSEVEAVAINPVDGMTKPRDEVRPATGNFASPTGFVNYDPVRESNEVAATPSSSSKVAGKFVSDYEAEAWDDSLSREHFKERTEAIEELLRRDEEESTKHYPLIKRSEPVFSGTKRVDRKPFRSRNIPRRPRLEGSEQGQHEQKSSRALRWTAGAGVLTAAAATAYALGTAKENRSEREREREWVARERAVREMREAAERWRWKLNNGFWKKGE